MVLRFFMFAAVIFLSCSVIDEVWNGGYPKDPEDRDNPFDEKSSTYIAPNIVYGEPVDYEGEIYKTVVIGTQTWFQSNLNYDASGSRCHDDKVANCNKYGRLYSWATAMALNDSCNTSNCNSLLSKNNKGICPDGWHIPNDEEWKTLRKFAAGEQAYYSNSELKYAGDFRLKTKNDWNNFKGLDTYGFSALPGGYMIPDYNDVFRSTGVGGMGLWQSADARYHVCMGSDYGGGGSYYYYYDSNYRCPEGRDESLLDRSLLFSVRCVKDDGVAPPSSSSLAQSSSSAKDVPSSSSVKDVPSSSSVKDVPSSSSKPSSSSSIEYVGGSCDVDKYRTKKIGGQTWMTENWSCYAKGSVCYNNEPRKCEEYGRLYNLEAAKTACPSGWHLSNASDWHELIASVNPDCENNNSCDVGKELKSNGGWDGSNGNNSSGFSALPGGIGDSGKFSGEGKAGNWWIADSADNSLGISENNSVNYSKVDASYFLSVRCVKN